MRIREAGSLLLCLRFMSRACLRMRWGAVLLCVVAGLLGCRALVCWGAVLLCVAAAL